MSRQLSNTKKEGQQLLQLPSDACYEVNLIYILFTQVNKQVKRLLLTSPPARVVANLSQTRFIFKAGTIR